MSASRRRGVVYCRSPAASQTSTGRGNRVTKLHQRAPSLRLLLFALAVFAVLAPSAAGSLDARGPTTPQGPPVRLQFLGQATLPIGTTFAGTAVGGLSSITWDP